MNALLVTVALAVVPVPHVHWMSSTEYTFGFPFNIYVGDSTWGIVSELNLNNLGANLLFALVITCGLVKFFNSDKFKILAEVCYRSLLLTAIVLPVIGDSLMTGYKYKDIEPGIISFFVVFLLIVFGVQYVSIHKRLVNLGKESKVGYWLSSHRVTFVVSALFCLYLYFFFSRFNFHP